MATLTPDAPTYLSHFPVPVLPNGGMTFEDYLTFERASPVKHHLHDGRLIDVAGASLEHNTVSSNLIGTLIVALDTTNCRALGSDMKVFVSRRKIYYPDVVVMCGDPILTFDEALQNPVLTAEVLSPSTSAFDRGPKFCQYRTLPTLRHLLFLEQDSPTIEHYERDEHGVWVLCGDYRSLEQSLMLTLGGEMISLPLSKIYRCITFPEGSEETDAAEGEA